MATPTPPRIIRLPEVRHMTGLSRSSIYAGMADGTFPKSIRISSRCVGWDSLAVQAWIDEKLEGAA